MDNGENLTWTKIDRDENGFATEECLYKIRKSTPCSLAMKYQNTVVYMSLNNNLILQISTIV